MFWEKLSHVQINERISKAVGENVNFADNYVLGLPASFLDEEEFYPDAPFLKDAPFLLTLIKNPNHIGCHTLTKDKGEPFFQGTQKIELEMLKVCAEEIYKAEPDGYDGYVAPGGTEANIQAMWIYRNYFKKEFNAKTDEIALVYSEDSHYSMPKGSNLLGIESIVLDVNENDRQIVQEDLENKISAASEKGIKYFILIQNMATTMFGSVDDIVRVTDYFEENKLNYKCHIDSAFGGFIYPFVTDNSLFSFKNERISSFTLDGHKMLQTPYGTGIFLIRKGMMNYVQTDEAKYVAGKDYTICGSRSGANAVALWMTLMIHGSDGWKFKSRNLIDRASNVCHKLNNIGVKYFRDPSLNIITIRAEFINDFIAKKYNLVPDNSEGNTKWWKVIVMPHVRQGILDEFITDLEVSLSGKTGS